MWTIYKKLNVSPNSYPLVIPIKQYSSDFILKIKLYSTDGDLDIEAGATTKIRGTKRDGNGFELTGTRIGNTCTFSGTKAQMQQMTAAHGRCVFEIAVEKNTKELITANFYLEVQRAAMDAGTVTSESIIEEFTDFQSKITAAQAAATAAQAQADRAEAAAESIDFGLDSVPTQGSTNAVSSGGVYAENSEIRNSINDANIRQNKAEGKIKSIPYGRSGTAGTLTVEYAEGRIKIDGTLSENDIVLEADSDAVPVGSPLSIPYRQSANSGLFEDNANARKVHVDAGRYRLVYNMLSGTVTKGGVIYTSNADFGSANVVRAFILKPDASASGYTLIKSNVTTEVDLEDGNIGIQILYCYNGCLFDNAVFELYLEKVVEEELPDTTLTEEGKPADAKATGDAIKDVNRDVDDAQVLINASTGKVKNIPLYRSGTAGELSVEYEYGKVTINGTLTQNDIALEADSDRVYTDATAIEIPYRQSFNSGMFSDNALARRIPIQTGRYRFVFNMLSGSVTKGDITYTSNEQFGAASVANAFLLKSDASSEGYTLIKTNVTTEKTLDVTEIGMQVLYCYNGCSFDNAVFELYLEKVVEEELPEINTLQSEIELLCGQSTVENLFRQGGYSRSGNPLGSTYRACYIVTTNYVSDDLIMLKTSGDYYLTILAWDSEGTFAGFRNSENSLTTTATQNVYWTQELWVSKYKELYPDLRFKIEITTKDTIDGTLTNIVPSEAVNAVAYYVGKDTGINPQYKAEMDATIASVHDAITEPALVFPLVTDIHYQSVNNFFDDCIDNIKTFAQSVKCDFILNLGDDTDGNQTQEITLARAYYMRKRFNEIDVPYYHAIGNHDTNYYQSHPKLSSDQIYSAYLSNTRGVHFDMTAGEKNFYKDFDELGIRLIVLDGNHNGAYAFSANTATWLANTALDTDYIVVIGVHFSPIAEQNWSSKAMTNAPAVASAIQGFVNNGGTVIQFCGHSHVDYAFSTPWLSIHCDCQKFEQVDTSTSGYAHLIENADDFDCPARVEGTATEDCWNVIIIKPISRTVDLIRFGAGNDRTYSF